MFMSERKCDFNSIIIIFINNAEAQVNILCSKVEIPTKQKQNSQISFDSKQFGLLFYDVIFHPHFLCQ